MLKYALNPMKEDLLEKRKTFAKDLQITWGEYSWCVKVTSTLAGHGYSLSTRYNHSACN